MSDALSDIRKNDRNRPRYSQVEYEAAIKEARKYIKFIEYHYPQTPGNLHQTTMYIVFEGELERLEEINENLTSDDIELEARSIIFDIRKRKIREKRS